MARLIDADALIDKCGGWYVEEGPEIGFIGDLRNLLDEQPAVDAAPVVHGRWVKSDIPNEKWKCSHCGAGCWYYDYEATVCRSRWCPSCGAKMDGGENGA